MDLLILPPFAGLTFFFLLSEDFYLAEKGSDELNTTEEDTN